MAVWRHFLLALLPAFVAGFLACPAHAAIVYGNDAHYVNPGFVSVTSVALTLGQSGNGSTLLVVIGAENSPGALTVTYDSVTMTLRGSASTGWVTPSFFDVYSVSNPVSGQNLDISGASALSPFSFMWFTYGGVSSVNPIGNVSITANTLITSNAGTVQSNSFLFTPSVATSTIIEYMAFAQNSGLPAVAGMTYAVTNGSVRRSLTATANSHVTGGGFGDYAPGSTTAFSLGESVNPNFNAFGGMLWGIELLPSAPTATPTFTVSPTSTATPTFTVSPTKTMTQTFTVSPTFTKSATPTDTETFTVSPTSTMTQTFSVSPTNTFTVSPTKTMTQTFKASPTNTFTVSPTKTMTQTFTVSPTFTKSATPTDTETFTVSPTSTMTQTFSVSPTNTFTVSPSITPTWTFSASPTNTFTVSPSITPTWTFSASPTNTFTVSPSITPTWTFSASPTNSFTVSPSITPTWTFSASPTNTFTVSPSITPTWTFSASPTNSFTVSPSITPTWTFSASPTNSFTVSPSIT